MSVLRVSNLSKSYRKYSSELKRVLTWFGFSFKPQEEVMVLNEVNFSIEPGEAVGIVGHNGAGKSTLLKIITGTLPATSGDVKVNGCVSAILELGMGFFPDFTGRQNAVYGLSMMGYTQQQIDEVMSEIEAFSEVGEYFDQPVRTYSSGMQMRVAFAVATSFRPDILIVDEALSVGDAYFQHKSFNRILRFKEQGTSLLFVSHDKASILALCERAILFNQGQVIYDGGAEEVMDYYNGLIADKESESVQQIKLASGQKQTRSGTGEAKVVEIALFNSKGKEVESVAVGENVELRVKVEVYQDLFNLVFGYGIKNKVGQVIFGTNTWHTNQIVHDPKKGEFYTFNVKFAADLGEGSHSIVTALTDTDTHLSKNYEWIDIALVFSVINFDKDQFAGLTWQKSEIKVERVV